MSSNDPRKEYEKYLGDTFNLETQELDTYKAKQKALNEKDKLNILLIGATGVGKSTLLNAVFGDDVAKAGVGEPMTQELKKYQIPSKGLTLWDTKGIEAKDYQGTLEQLKTDIQAAIDEALNSDNPELNLPHVAWLCIKETSSRVEERDIELLELMRDNRIPTIVVFTNTQYEQGDSFYQEAKILLDKKLGTFLQGRYVRVNSIPYTIMGMSIPVSGLDDLLKITDTCLSEVAYFSSQRITDRQREALWKAQIVNHEKKLQSMINGATEKVNYAMAAAGAAGLLPIPFSDMFAISAIQTTMIQQINSEFEVEAELGSLITNLMNVLSMGGLSYLGKIVAGAVLKFVPWGSLAGAAISGTVAATITKSIGEAYIQVLKSYYNVETGKVEVPAEMSGFLDMFKTVYEQKKLENK